MFLTLYLQVGKDWHQISTHSKAKYHDIARTPQQRLKHVNTACNTIRAVHSHVVSVYVTIGDESPVQGRSSTTGHGCTVERCIQRGSHRLCWFHQC